MKLRNVLLMVAPLALMACSAKSPTVTQATADTPDIAAGAAAAASASDIGSQIYSGKCLPCHQQNGQGIPGVYPSLAGSPVVLGDPAELARWVIKGERPPSMPAGRFPTQMLVFGSLKDGDAAALFTYLRSNFGNAAAPVDAAAVAKAVGQ